MLSSRARCLVSLALSAIPLLVPVQGARAQDSEPAAPSDERLGYLSEAFRYINCDSHAHGVLLAIDPQRTRDAIHGGGHSITVDPSADATDDAVRLPLYAPKDRYGLNAAPVARHYLRQLIHLQTLTVFAPTKMRIFKPDLPPADPFFGMSTAEKMRRFEGSLNPAQWQALTSPQGVGAGDLSRQQLPLFTDLLPQDLRLKNKSSRWTMMAT